MSVITKECIDVFGPSSGLQDSNSSGPSMVENSEYGYLTYGNSGILSISSTLTIDSTFYSKLINQRGGNQINSGCLYEIWIDGWINSDDTTGSGLNSGDSLVLTNLTNLKSYFLTVVATQEVNDTTYGHITKVILLDTQCSSELKAYISSNPTNFSIVFSANIEYSDKGVFPIENNIDYRVNNIKNDDNREINTVVLSKSTLDGSNSFIWIDGNEDFLAYPQLSIGESVALIKTGNESELIETYITSTPSYLGQVSDTSSAVSINLGSLKITDLVVIPLQGTNFEIQYKKGDEIYVSNTVIDIRSGDHGLNYFVANVVDFTSNTITAYVTSISDHATGVFDSWYVISKVDRLHIPIAYVDSFSGLSSSDLQNYKFVSCTTTVRLQVTPNSRFKTYVFRYKPTSSSLWRYVDATENDTAIGGILPYTIYEHQIMGYADNINNYCGYSDSFTLNTFH